MNPNDYLSLFALTIAVVAGGGFGLQRQRLAALRGDVGDLNERVTIRDVTIADLERKDREKDARISELGIELKHAEQMALREQAWSDLDAHLAEHHREALEGLTRIEAGIAELARLARLLEEHGKL
jgi:hypothetical protein